MGLTMIAIIGNNEGFRLFVPEMNKYIDMTAENVAINLQSGKITVNNLGYAGNKFIGTNGKLNRYPVLDKCLRVISDRNTFVVLNKIGNLGYTLMDCYGTVIKVSPRNIEKQLEYVNIANAEIVTAGYGLAYLRPIHGKFDVITTIDSINAKLSMLGITDYEVTYNGSVHVLNINMRKCIMPNGVTSIDDSTFLGCVNLEEVGFPSTLKHIGTKAFFNCVSLKNIEIPESVKVLDSYAFAGCNNLSKVVMHDGLSEIDYGAFLNCGSIREIDIPNTVRELGCNAFFHCSNLQTVRIGASLREIEEKTFCLCNLKTLYIPKNVKYVHNAFDGCSSLSRIILESTDTVICSDLLDNCGSIKIVHE